LKAENVIASQVRSVSHRNLCGGFGFEDMFAATLCVRPSRHQQQ
jgi:hypothetical protein